MKNIYLIIASLFIIQITFAQPANDDCSGAENITVTTSSTLVSFDINTAVLANQTICSTVTDFADVWFEFTMPVNGNLHIDGSIVWNNFALYNACGGTEIQCGNANEFFTNLSSGNAYVLRVYRTSSTAANTQYQGFTIKAYEEVTNDDCASAETIPVTTTASTVNFEIGGASINNEEGCSGTTADYLDLWYDFSMPVNGNLYVDGTIAWNIFALYDSCGGTEIQCGSSDALFTGLISGTNYKLRLFRTLANAGINNYKSFTIKAFEEVANDDCASAENITVTTTVSTVNFEIGGATINNEEGCSGTTAEYADIWYDFTMPVNGNLYVDGSIAWNIFALYDSCGGTEIQCGTDKELFTGLTSGANYKLRLFRTRVLADENNYRSFTIQAFEQVTNDDCASAETIVVTTASSTVNFDIGGASVNNEEGCSGTTAEYADIWYDFTMPVNGNLNVDGSIAWNNFALYNACGGIEIQCGSDNELIVGLTATTNYKLRVFRSLATTNNNAYRSFTMQAFEIINNDDCATAETIVVSNTLATINFGIAGATINNEVGCEGTAAQDYADIWYEFIMPEDGDIAVDGTISWNNFALYDACSGTELGCFDDANSFIGLTNGTTYKLRVFRTLATASNTAYKNFTIKTTNTLGIETNAFENAIRIFPNPTSSRLSISSAIPIHSIALHDINGREIHTGNFNETLDLSNLRSGVYFLTLTSDHGSATRKIIKQ